MNNKESILYKHHEIALSEQKKDVFQKLKQKVKITNYLREFDMVKMNVMLHCSFLVLVGRAQNR